MKIALVQSHIFWEDKDRNISNFEDIVSGNPDAELFLLPEMSFTGFSMNTEATADRDRETVRRIRDIAVRCRTAIGFGWVRKAGKKCENVYKRKRPPKKRRSLSRDDRIRTCDILVPNQARYQLRYIPK